MKNILPWFKLKSVSGIGNYLFKKLIDKFKTPEGVFSASKEELLSVEGISHRLITAIRNQKVNDSIKKDLDLTFKNGYKVVVMADSEYPALLHQLPDPPPFIYVYGCLEKHINNIAIVGSRNATNYGLSMANQLGEDLANNNMTVVSGMALGIDTASHIGALSGNGRTVAVLGSGLGRIYPAVNKNLFHRISENGAVISEFPILTEPESHNFPLRNRIICGMSLGTVVVEATQKSGSLITARLATEQGREVFAVPGSIRSFKSTGTHKLLKQGAKLVENVNDILEEVSHFIDYKTVGVVSESEKVKNHQTSLAPEEQIILNGLDAYPIHIDEITRKFSIESGKLSGILLKLELSGLVIQHPGKLFSTVEEQ